MPFTLIVIILGFATVFPTESLSFNKFKRLTHGSKSWGINAAHCPIPPPDLVAPVCGSNGKSYFNQHYLEYVNCVNSINGEEKILIDYYGWCTKVKKNADEYHKDKTKENTEERSHTLLVHKHNAPQKCFIENPPYFYDEPTCGTDFKIYRNPHILKFYKCIHNANTTEQPFIKCENNKVDKSKCPPPKYVYYSVLCATDNKSYLNRDELAHVNCLNQLKRDKSQLIEFNYEGWCSHHFPTTRKPRKKPLSPSDKCFQPLRANYTFESVCGSDGNFYWHLYDLEYQSCLNFIEGKENITVEHPDWCNPKNKNSRTTTKPRTTTTKKEEPTTTRPMTLEEQAHSICYDRVAYDIPVMHDAHVCGSDGNTYFSQAHLEYMNCIYQIHGNSTVSLIRYGKCRSDNQESTTRRFKRRTINADEWQQHANEY